MKSLIIIPCRMESTRLPGKPLLMAGGKALVHWTYEAAKRTRADHIVVTSDSQRIAMYCKEHGLTFWPSPVNCENGTNRCAEVVKYLKSEVRESLDVVCNWQVDSVLVDPADVDKLIDMEPSDSIGTIVARKGTSTSVRVAVDEDPTCHWFSRMNMTGALHHVGIYAFSPDMLIELSRLQTARLAKAESLEQLTWIVNGYCIEAIEIERAPLSVDTQDDWDWFKQFVETTEHDD